MPAEKVKLGDSLSCDAGGIFLLQLKFRTIQKKESLPHENTTLTIQSDLSRQAKNVSPSNTSTMAVTPI